MTWEISRRTFLGACGASALASRWSYAGSPNGELTVAFVGTGNQGMGLLKRVLKWNLARVVAVCDVNQGSFGYRETEHFYGREPAAKLVDEHYQKLGLPSKCAMYTDFRDVFARKDIDAVFLVVPDHWHTPMTILAAQAGKHIYCEKPLTLAVAEGREMIEAVRANKVILQTGSHERSNPISRFVCESVKHGAVGQVTRVLTQVGFNNKIGPGPGWKPERVPETFGYDMWLGPAPQVPYHHDRCLYRFRFNYDYSGGQITNFGAHANDMAHWGLDLDRSGPTEIECMHAEFLPEGSLFNTATVTKFRCKYANGVELICESGLPPVQTRFEGTDGWIQTGYGGTTASRPELLAEMPKYNKKREMDPHSLHLKNFVDSVQAGHDPVAPVEIGHHSAVLCHLANVAIRRFPQHGRQLLKWDATKEQFTNNDEANESLVRPRREAWKQLG